MPDSIRKTDSPIIGIVGVCASGKSTIIKLLSEKGYHCRHIAQEHSYVPTMWMQITHPDFLIYLEASYPVTISRKKLNWTIAEYNEEVYRLRHAYTHASLVIDTDNKTPDQITSIIISKLSENGFIPDPR